MLKDGQETASMFLDGNRTRIFSLFASCSNAVELPSAITEAQRPIQKNDGQRASWESIGCPMVRGLNALAVSRFADNPNSAARRNWRARWESNPHLPNSSGILSQLNYGTVREANLTDAVLSRAHHMTRFGK